MTPAQDPIGEFIWIESNKPIKQSICQSINQLEQSKGSNQDNQESNHTRAVQESKSIGLSYENHFVIPLVFFWDPFSVS